MMRWLRPEWRGLANDGLLRLPAKLSAPGKLIVIIRDRRTDVVVDILTETGSVLEDELPIFTALVGEQLLLMPDDEHHEVLVVFSIQDLAVLRACGIPATLAAGMECLCPADIDRLCEIFGLDRKKSRRIEESEFGLEDEAEQEPPGTLDPIQRLTRFGAAGRGPDASTSIPGEHPDEEVDSDAAEEDSMGKRLVFVAWSPATLEIGPPVEFDAVTAHFKELKQYMGLDLYEVHVWTASSEDVKRLQFLMHHRDAGAARGVLLDCLYERMQGLEYLGKERAQGVTVPADLPAAVLMLRESLFFEGLDGDRVRRQREALQHVEQLLHKQVVGPMMDEAMESPGAPERAIGLATAQLVQMFLTQGVAINARVAKAISRKGMAGLETLPLEEIKSLLEWAIVSRSSFGSWIVVGNRTSM